MQNRYVGDIGDFIKLAILREFLPGYRLGVAWWLFPDESHNRDGRHIDYLASPSRWRELDPELFDSLAEIVRRGDRSVRALEQQGLLRGAVFSSTPIPTGGTPRERIQTRATWFARVEAEMSGRDLIFLDPDNGLETTRYRPGAVSAGKSVSLAALASLSIEGRTLVVYHHQTRRKGGHFAELEYWADRLRNFGFSVVDAIRSSPYSPRAFFLLNANSEIRDRAINLVKRWGGKLSWHPDRYF